MDRPVKRQRIAPDSPGTDDEDELECEPNELNKRRDPVYQLEQARARASNRLKSRFEDIFAKYEKDFTGIGDEIDLRTGKVVVNNGHLQSITSVQEFGEGGEDEREGARCSGNDRPVHGISDEALGNDSSNAAAQGDPRLAKGSNPDSPQAAASMGGIPRPSSVVNPAHDSFMPPNQPSGLWRMGHAQVVDPAWQTPELPQSAFMGTGFVSQVQQRTIGPGQVTQVTRRSLMRPRSQDCDEEDVLLGASHNVLGTNESPLIKSKFPAVGSSPNNDAGLHEMIQSVIENIAATSPSSEQSRKRASCTRPSPKSSIKSASPDTDNHCTQGKRKTSEECTSPTSKPTADSVSRVDEEPRHNNRLRGSQTAIRPPENAITSHKKRQPKTHIEQRIADPTGEPDASGMDEEFLDITGNTPLKPAGQVFYVEIKARKIGRTNLFAQYHSDDELDALDRSSLGVDGSDETLNRPFYGSSGVEEKPTKMPSESRVVELAANFPDHGGARKPGIDGALSQRKTHDPTSASTGAHNLSSREQKRVSPPTSSDSQALQESQPSGPRDRSKEQFERNLVHPSYTFSDEEDLLPRRKRNTGRDSKPASRASLAAQGASRVGKKAEAEKIPPTTVTLDASDQVNWSRATRTSEQSISAATHATDASNPSQGRSSEHVVFDGPLVLPMSPSHRRTRRNSPEEPGSARSRQQATAKAGSRSLRCHYQTEPGDDLQGPGQRSSPVVASVPAGAKDDATSGHPTKTAESALVPPSTPQPKSKLRFEKAGTSRSELISLLSDDDDGEDEISFNLADFTPSGHHRILALRPDANLPATASTGKRRRVASLLFGPASTSKVSKHSAPGWDNKNRKRRRRSTNTLAGSVVKARRDNPRAPSPGDSVVQTPGGTKRRCGEDGFRCERDFCFVCISI